MAMIRATFEGGPLDGRSKPVPNAPEYRYREQRRGRYAVGNPNSRTSSTTHIYRRSGPASFTWERAEG